MKLFATVAVFDLHQNNVVSTTPSITPVFGTQTGRVEVYGAELEFVARFYDQPLDQRRLQLQSLPGAREQHAGRGRQSAADHA